MSNDFDYKKVLMDDGLLEINNLINAVNTFYCENEINYNPYHSIFNDSVYSLEVKHKLGTGYPFGRLCSISTNPILNLYNQEIFKIEDGIVKFPDDLCLSMNKIIFQNKPLKEQNNSKFEIYFELLSKIENVINKQILSFTNFEFLNKDNKIIVNLKIKIFILSVETRGCDYQYEDIIEIDNLDFNNESYWKTICFKIMPNVFNGIDEDDVKNSPTEDMLEQLKLLNY